MSQMLLKKHFKWVEDISEFTEYFIKSCNDESNEEHFLEVDVEYPADLHNFYNDLEE